MKNNCFPRNWQFPSVKMAQKSFFFICSRRFSEHWLRRSWPKWLKGERFVIRKNVFFIWTRHVQSGDWSVAWCHSTIEQNKYFFISHWIKYLFVMRLKFNFHRSIFVSARGILSVYISDLFIKNGEINLLYVRRKLPFQWERNYLQFPKVKLNFPGLTA